MEAKKPRENYESTASFLLLLCSVGIDSVSPQAVFLLETDRQSLGKGHSTFDNHACFSHLSQLK